MTTHQPADHNDDRRPSQVTDDFWVYARRPHGPAQKPTQRSGKWMLFVPKEEIDEAWATVKRATQEGRLGCASKAATARYNPHEITPETKVVCVYTYDGDDWDDVGRVLRELRCLGFAGRPLLWHVIGV
jgi:hypothetical protein